MTDHPANCIKFCSPPTEEVLRLDKEGFHYRGQFIAALAPASNRSVLMLAEQFLYKFVLYLKTNELGHIKLLSLQKCAGKMLTPTAFSVLAQTIIPRIL